MIHKSISTNSSQQRSPQVNEKIPKLTGVGFWQKLTGELKKAVFRRCAAVL